MSLFSVPGNFRPLRHKSISIGLDKLTDASFPQRIGQYLVIHSHNHCASGCRYVITSSNANRKSSKDGMADLIFP